MFYLCITINQQGAPVAFNKKNRIKIMNTNFYNYSKTALEESMYALFSGETIKTVLDAYTNISIEDYFSAQIECGKMYDSIEELTDEFLIGEVLELEPMFNSARQSAVQEFLEQYCNKSDDIIIPKQHLDSNSLSFTNGNSTYRILGRMFKSFEDSTGAFDTESEDYPSSLQRCAYELEEGCLIKMKLEDNDTSTEQQVQFYAPINANHSALVVGCDSNGDRNSDKAGIYNNATFSDYWDEFGDLFQTEKTYNVHFNDNSNSNDEGFSATLEYCESYIEFNQGTDHSYFEDYKGGIVSIVCNETGETVSEEVIR